MTNQPTGYEALKLTSREQEAGEEPEGREIDLPEDIYGATMFSIIFDTYDVFGSERNDDELHISMNVMRMMFSIVVLITNFLLQGGMLFWILRFVALPSVHTVQAIYQRYHAEIFDAEGKRSLEKWQSWDDESREELCQIAFSSYWFMFAILCLWCFAMLIEIRKTDRLMRDIISVDDATNLKDIIQKVDEGIPSAFPPIRIVKLTKALDWFLFLFLIVPKFVIGLLLLLIGCVWLMATDSFSDLILNAIALEFVVNIDNVLFEAAMPESIKEKMAATKFWVKEAKPSKDAEAQKITKSYLRSMFYFFGVFAFVAAMMSVGQLVPWVGVFPNYAHDAFCPAYWVRVTERLCNQGEDCFPFGGE